MNTYRNHFLTTTDPTGAVHVKTIVDWERITLARLTWCHGPERARAIFNGEDEAANADLAAWRSLGERRAA